jgi:hypothetical protein
MRCRHHYSPLGIAPQTLASLLRLFGWWESPDTHSRAQLCIFQVSQSLSRGRHLYTYDMLSYYMFSAANALQSPVHVSFTAMLCWRIIIRPCHRQSRAGEAEGSWCPTKIELLICLPCSGLVPGHLLILKARLDSEPYCT